jgi:beta-lactamase class D
MEVSTILIKKTWVTKELISINTIAQLRVEQVLARLIKNLLPFTTKVTALVETLTFYKTMEVIVTSMTAN